MQIKQSTQSAKIQFIFICVQDTGTCLLLITRVMCKTAWFKWEKSWMEQHIVVRYL